LRLWRTVRRAPAAERPRRAPRKSLESETNESQEVNISRCDISSYFELREIDLALEIARRTLASRQDSLRLTEVLAKYGFASQLDLRQAQDLVGTAAESIPDFERQIQQQEDLISNLLGQNPGAIPRGLPLTQHPAPSAVPPGLPSKLLERRPNIREAEASLMAANADTGVGNSTSLSR